MKSNPGVDQVVDILKRATIFNQQIETLSQTDYQKKLSIAQSDLQNVRDEKAELEVELVKQKVEF